MSEEVIRKRSRVWNKIKLWAKRVDLENKAAYVLFVGLVISGVTAYALFSNVAPLEPTPDNLYIFVLFITILLFKFNLKKK
mgnify:FL=1